MKQLVCEMCGSTDLIKQDGVFVCQTCGCKYSVEEAKKMMVEGTVDVSGSTVKVDSSEKLKNLYILARRAKNDNNSEDAAKYYADIRIEDPDSWEAAYYGVYYTAMNCRIGQIASAATSVSNCIDSVMDLIIEHVPKNEQKDAYTEVAVRTQMIGTLLFDAAKNTYIGSSYSDAEHDFRERASRALIAILSAGIAVDEKFEDVELAKKIYEDARKLCQSFYASKIYTQVVDEKIQGLKPRFEEIKKKRVTEYWDAHLEQKQALEGEKAGLKDNTKNIDDQIEALPDNKNVKEIETSIVSLKREYDGLGFFKKKEKKALQERINEAEKQLLDAKKKLEERAKPLREESERMKRRIAEIDNTLSTVPPEATASSNEEG